MRPVDVIPARNEEQAITDMPARDRTRRLRVVWRAVRVVLLAVIVLSIGRYVQGNLPVLSAIELSFEPRFAALAIAGGIGWILVQSMLWQRLLATAGHAVRWREAIPQVWLPNLGKYIPGKVWAAVGRVFLCKLSGVPGARAAVALLVENVSFILAGAIFAAVVLPLTGAAENRELQGLLVPLGLAVALGLLVVHPAVWGTVARWILRFARRPPVVPDFDYRTSLGFVALYVGSWAILGLGMYGFSRTFVDIPASEAVRVAGLYVIAWSVGYVSMLSPAGLGVREGIMMAGLGASLGADAVIVIAVGLRLYFTTLDILAAMLAAASSPAMMRALWSMEAVKGRNP